MGFNSGFKGLNCLTMHKKALRSFERPKIYTRRHGVTS